MKNYIRPIGQRCWRKILTIILSLVGWKKLDLNITGRKDILEKWLEALRSGQYVQAFGRERTHDNRFCALGVLNDVLEKNKFGCWTVEMDWKGQPFYIFKDSYDGYLNDAFIAWRIDLKVWDIIRLNDDNRFSLKQIANEIEARKLESCRT